VLNSGSATKDFCDGGTSSSAMNRWAARIHTSASDSMPIGFSPRIQVADAI
jgi:hypothetical protein